MVADIHNHNHNQQVRQKQEGTRLQEKDSVINKEFSWDTQNQEIRSSDKVLIIGLGQLGLPVARYVRERGFDTYGYDISIAAMERAYKIAGIKEVTSFREIDVYIICVSTHDPEDMSTPQIEGLLSVVQEISMKAKNGALVSIESTIPRGTSKKVFEMLNHRMHVAHVPHRFYSLEEKDHGVNQVRIVGGVCDCCLKAAIQFYSGSHDVGVGSIDMNARSNDIIISSTSSTDIRNQIKNDDANNNMNLGIPFHCVSDIEIAEITKIAVHYCIERVTRKS